MLLLSFRCHLILFVPFFNSYLNQKGNYFCCGSIIPGQNKGNKMLPQRAIVYRGYMSKKGLKGTQWRGGLLVKDILFQNIDQYH